MSKIYPYAVKYNGKYYPPNVPIKVSVEKPVETVDKPRKGKVKKNG